MRVGTHHGRGRDMRVIFGAPAREAVAAELERAGSRRVLLFTSPSARRTAYLAGLERSLGARLAGIFDGCTAHTPSAAVLAGIEAARAAGADALLAVGGGSVMDGGKLVGVGFRRGLTSEAEILALSPDTPPGERDVTVVAVPTTLSGAEFTTFAGVTDVAAGRKVPIDDPGMAPAVVVLDPAATAEVPEWLTLSAGIRAVDHCVEAYLSTGSTPFGDALAVEGLRLLAASLPRIRSAPDDLAARQDALSGAWLAISAPALGVPLGASHAIGRVLGGLFGVAHGHTSCVMLAASLRWSEAAAGERAARLAAILNAATAAEGVARLVRDLGQPGTLGALGIGRDRYAEIAERSLVMLGHHSVAGNIRPVTTARDVTEILALAE